MFGLLERARSAQYLEDYVITQAALEEIFLTFATQQREQLQWRWPGTPSSLFLCFKPISVWPGSILWLIKDKGEQQHLFFVEIERIIEW